MTSVAEEIGRDHIARVVNEFYDRVQQHPTLATPFHVVKDWAEHKDHLSYFWWVTLGGTKDREIPFSVVIKHARAGFSAELLRDWKVLFSEVIRAQVPEPLGQMWLAKVDRLGTSLLFANNLHASQRRSPA